MHRVALRCVCVRTPDRRSRRALGMEARLQPRNGSISRRKLGRLGYIGASIGHTTSTFVAECTSVVALSSLSHTLCSIAGSLPLLKVLDLLAMHARLPRRKDVALGDIEVRVVAQSACAIWG